MNYLMSNNRRAEVRATARWAYLDAARRFTSPKENKPEIKRIAVGKTRVALVESGKFSSLLGSLLLSIAMKLIVRLVEKWLDENLFSVKTIPPKFTEGEPGYVAPRK